MSSTITVNPKTVTILPSAGIPKPTSLGVSHLPGTKVTPKLPNPTDDRTCYVQNSKNGDILNILPILHQKFSETEKAQVLMVSEKYAGLLTGCSYIEPYIWDGDWVDLAGAMLKAGETFKSVVSLSTFGKTINVVKQTPSFALEQWRLAGHLEQFGTWPLVFDRRNPEREEALVKKHLKPREKCILFADHSESSPFEHTDKMIQLLKDEFGKTHKILRLSEVRAEFVYDLLGIYDRAAALVSIETMHLHLAAASSVPVIALATTKPEMWHGTPWRGNFSLHCRYVDFELRRDEVVSAIKDAIALRERPNIEITGRNGYNMTSLQWNGQRIGVYRWHPKADSWRTELAAWTGSKTVRVSPPKGFEPQSIEDGRLFLYNGKLHLSYTVANQKGCVVQYGELDTTSEPWRIVNFFQPKYPGNDFTTLVKNWSFWESGGKLYAAYQRSPEQIVLQLDGEKVMNEFKTQAPAWAWGQIRGGTSPIEHNGLNLQFFHSSTRNNKSPWGFCYYMGALLMEKEPPFSIVSVSRAPILAGTERYFAAPRWKPRVVFPMGAIKDGEKFVVSMGVNDAVTGRVTLKEGDLNL